MARLRTLKPEFFTHELLAELSPLHRLLYQGLWCHADREGRLEDRPRYLKTVILPYDSCDVDRMLSDLEAKGFIRRYEADGKRCIAIPTFLHHQNPHPKDKPSFLPPPPIGAAPNGPRPETPAQGTAIIHAAEIHGKPRETHGEPRHYMSEPGSIDSRSGSWSGPGSASGFDAAALKSVPEPEAFEPDETGEYQPTAWGFWGWHNKERQEAGLFHEATPPTDLPAWFETAAAKLGIPGVSQAYRVFLDDPEFATDRGKPFAVFRSPLVYEARASAKKPRKAWR